MDMPIEAQVKCLDGICGQSTCVIIDPKTRIAKFVMVEDMDEPDAQYLVPLDEIKLSAPHLIQLRCTKYELKKKTRFAHVDYQWRAVPLSFYPPGNYMIAPIMVTENARVRISQQEVPAGELAVCLGAEVRASDGYVGQLEEFLLDPATEHIDYLVLHERHLWRLKELIVPASQIGQFKDNTIYLKSDKQTIEQLQNAAAHSKNS